MSRINIILFLSLTIIIQISSTLTINMKTKQKFMFYNIKSYKNITISINNNTVNLSSSSNDFDCQSDYGEVEIVIEDNIIDLSKMFDIGNFYGFHESIQSIKIKSLNTYVISVYKMFFYQRGLTFVD